MLLLPLLASAPLQAPEAVHAVAFVEFQVSVLALPLLTDVGVALKETVGVDEPEPPPQAASSHSTPRQPSKVETRMRPLVIFFLIV
ncbi:MAG TPA: hypothetical protein VIY54_00785 [Steroidobacteraceae bacterium]